MSTEHRSQAQNVGDRPDNKWSSNAAKEQLVQQYVLRRKDRDRSKSTVPVQS